MVPCRPVRRAAAARPSQTELAEDGELGEATSQRRPTLLRGGRCVRWLEAMAGAWLLGRMNAISLRVSVLACAFNWRVLAVEGGFPIVLKRSLFGAQLRM